MCLCVLGLAALCLLGMSLTRNCYLRVVGPIQLIVIGDAGRRLYTTIERRTLDQRCVQGWKFSSLLFRLCCLQVSLTIGTTASIFLVFNDQRILMVTRSLIQGVSKSLGFCVLFFVFWFLYISDLVPLAVWLTFGTNPVHVSTLSSTKSSLTL